MKEKVGEIFSIAKDNAPVVGCTISKEVYGGENSIIYFSLERLPPTGERLQAILNDYPLSVNDYRAFLNDYSLSLNDYIGKESQKIRFLKRKKARSGVIRYGL